MTVIATLAPATPAGMARQIVGDDRGFLLRADGAPLTPLMTPADLILFARRVAAGDGRARTDPLALNTLALGVLVFAHLLTPTPAEEAETP